MQFRMKLTIFVLCALLTTLQLTYSNPDVQGSCPTMPVLSCPPASNEKGSPGFPGKRGPIGMKGIKGVFLVLFI